MGTLVAPQLFEQFLTFMGQQQGSRVNEGQASNTQMIQNIQPSHSTHQPTVSFTAGRSTQGSFNPRGGQRRGKHQIRTSKRRFIPKLRSKSNSVHGVHNLSRHFKMDATTSSLLSKGHKFVPTTKPSENKDILKYVSELRQDLYKKAFFLNNAKSCEEYNPDIKAKSAWQPPADKHVDNFICDLTNRLEAMLAEDRSKVSVKYFNNLSKRQIRAIRNLKHNHAIVIKVSDKNLGLTIMDFLWYDNECLRQLKDKAVYIQLEEGEIEQIKFVTTLTLSKMLEKYKNILTKQESRFLQIYLRKSNIPCFYILPKLHKDPIVGRPIVAGHSWITVGCSKLLTSYLKTLLPLFPNILKDSTTLIQIIEREKFDSNIVLCTLDVVSLYTNIPVDHAIEVLQQLIQENLHLFPRKELAEFMLEMLHFVLKHNVMEYKQMVFKQIFGIAMGTPLAPVLANLYLAFLERILKEKSTEANIIWPLLYKRFIDDCFIVYQGDRAQLTRFIDMFNSLVESISLSLESFGISVNFLDLTIYKGKRFRREGRLDIKIFQKPMNKYLYLPFSTEHPVHCLKSFVTTELQRYIKASSDKSAYLTIANLFYKRLLNREFPADALSEWFSTVDYKKRNLYLFQQDVTSTSPEDMEEMGRDVTNQPKNSRCVKTQPLIYKVQYNQRLKRMKLSSIFKQTVEEHRNISASFGAVTKDLEPIVCYTRGPNLGQKLIRASVQQST